MYSMAKKCLLADVATHSVVQICNKTTH